LAVLTVAVGGGLFQLSLAELAELADIRVQAAAQINLPQAERAGTQAQAVAVAVAGPAAVLEGVAVEVVLVFLGLAQTGRLEPEAQSMPPAGGVRPEAGLEEKCPSLLPQILATRWAVEITAAAGVGLTLASVATSLALQLTGQYASSGRAL
jgi:hypothetical protein